MNQIEQRIVRLEKSLRTYRLLFGFSIVAIFSVVLMSSGKKADVPDIVKAKAFQVVDDDGNVLVLINKERGNGQMATYSTKGQKLVRLFTSDGGAGAINTFDPSGRLNFKVTRTTEGGGYMALYNSAENEVMEVGVTKSDAGYLQINDNAGTKLGWLTKASGGGGYLSLSANGKEALVLSSSSIGGRLSIYNGLEKRVGYMGSEDDENGYLSVSDKYGSRKGSIPSY